MKPTGRILLQIVLLSALAIGLNPGTAGAQSSFDGFKPEDYIAVTDRYKLPPPAKGSPLAAAKRFVEARPNLDPAKTNLIVLHDEPNRRVFRFTVVCKSKEQCGDDSVAESREAIDLRRRDRRWQIVWVGVQVRCHPGRGHASWSKQPCS